MSHLTPTFCGSYCVVSTATNRWLCYDVAKRIYTTVTQADAMNETPRHLWLLNVRCLNDHKLELCNDSGRHLHATGGRLRVLSGKFTFIVESYGQHSFTIKVASTGKFVSAKKSGAVTTGVGAAGPHERFKFCAPPLSATTLPAAAMETTQRSGVAAVAASSTALFRPKVLDSFALLALEEQREQSNFLEQARGTNGPMRIVTSKRKPMPAMPTIPRANSHDAARRLGPWLPPRGRAAPPRGRAVLERLNVRPQRRVVVETLLMPCAVELEGELFELELDGEERLRQWDSRHTSLSSTAKTRQHHQQHQQQQHGTGKQGLTQWHIDMAAEFATMSRFGEMMPKIPNW